MKSDIERRIRLKLAQQKMTVSELANRVGVSRVALYHLFKGNYSREMLEKISSVLTIPVHILLTPVQSSSASSKIDQVVSNYQAASKDTQLTVDRVLGIHDPATTGQRPIVAVLDDLQENVDMVRRILRKEFEVRDFTDPVQALQFVRTSHVDAVVTDQRMPVMTGTQFLSEIQRLERPIVKIILSGYSDNEALVEAINNAHVDAFMLKPFQPQDLVTKLQNNLKDQDKKLSKTN